MELRLLDSTTLPDWLDFFEHRAFTDNPDWASCYCMAYLYEGGGWDEALASENRAAAIALTEAGAASGVMAYEEGVPVGWVRAGPKTSLPVIRRWEAAAAADDDRVGSIVCFVVAPEHRGQGVAGVLLEGACDHLSDLGLTVAEAYPPQRIESPADAFPGPLQLYLHHGFRVVRELRRRAVVRRDLSSR